MPVNAQLQHKAIKRSVSGHVTIRCGGLFCEKNKNKRDSQNWISVISHAENEHIVRTIFFKLVFHAVQKSFDSFGAVLIDLLSHFNLIVLFCGIVAAYCV